jgi:hypothetical protein
MEALCWIYWDPEGLQYGPFSLATYQNWLKQGHLAPETPVSNLEKNQNRVECSQNLDESSLSDVECSPNTQKVVCFKSVLFSEMVHL